jgi:hypothetical protein
MPVLGSLRFQGRTKRLGKPAVHSAVDAECRCPDVHTPSIPHTVGHGLKFSSYAIRGGGITSAIGSSRSVLSFPLSVIILPLSGAHLRPPPDWAAQYYILGL